MKMGCERGGTFANVRYANVTLSATEAEGFISGDS